MKTEYPRTFVISHPLIKDKLTRLRDESTPPIVFRVLLRELAMLMAFEVTRDFVPENVMVSTPLGMESEGVRISADDIMLITILRAGIGMADGVMEVIPQARVGHIGIYRDPETLQAVNYYSKLPKMNQARMVIIIDPMLATGHTMVETLRICRGEGVSNIRIMCLVAAPEGIREVRKYDSDTMIFTAAIDEKLNSHGYILPGLGDAGDRIFGTR